MNKKILIVAGFLLFTAGVLSVILSLVGLEWTPVAFIYGKGVWTFVMQVIFLFGGIIMMYVARLEEDSE